MVTHKIKLKTYANNCENLFFSNHEVTGNALQHNCRTSQ